MDVKMLIILLMAVMVPFFAALVVYKDASKRDMNAELWGLIAFFGPLGIGLVVYFITRKPITELQCSKCGASLKWDDNECTECNSMLLNNCDKCGFPLRKKWKNCPQCGNELPEDYAQSVHTYKPEKINSIIPILLVCILVVVVVSSFIWYSNNVADNYSYTIGGFSGMYNITTDDLSKNETLAEWIKECDKSSEKVFAIMSESSDTCIVYVKDSDKHIRDYTDFCTTDEGVIQVVNIEKMSAEDKFGYDFLLYEYDVTKNSELKVNIGNTDYEVKITRTNDDISQSTWRTEYETTK